MIQAARKEEKHAWLYLHQPFAGNAIEKEVAAKCLNEHLEPAGAPISNDVRTTGSEILERARDPFPIFNFLMRPRSKSDSRGSSDRPSVREGLMRNHKRHLNASARIVATDDGEVVAVGRMDVQSDKHTAGT